MINLRKMEGLSRFEALAVHALGGNLVDADGVSCCKTFDFSPGVTDPPYKVDSPPPQERLDELFECDCKKEQD